MVLKSLNTDTVIGNCREIVKLTMVREKFNILQKNSDFGGNQNFGVPGEEHFWLGMEIFGFSLGGTDPGCHYVILPLPNQKHIHMTETIDSS